MSSAFPDPGCERRRGEERSLTGASGPGGDTDLCWKRRLGKAMSTWRQKARRRSRRQGRSSEGTSTREWDEEHQRRMRPAAFFVMICPRRPRPTAVASWRRLLLLRRRDEQEKGWGRGVDPSAWRHDQQTLYPLDRMRQSHSRQPLGPGPSGAARRPSEAVWTEREASERASAVSSAIRSRDRARRRSTDGGLWGRCAAPTRSIARTLGTSVSNGITITII